MVLQVLDFYVSSFWNWAGITIGLSTIFASLGGGVAAILRPRGD